MALACSCNKAKLSPTLFQTPKTGFLIMGLIIYSNFVFVCRLAKKRGRKTKDVKDESAKDGKKSQAAGKGTSTSQEKIKTAGKHDVDHTVSKTGSNTERPESHQTEKSDSQTAADIEK